MNIRISSLLLIVSLTLKLFSQPTPNTLLRLGLEPELGPFYHGVASGDPLPDAVIIWTRVTTEDPLVTVTWKMATDTLFNAVVRSGNATTEASKDYTVKVDVTGLQPATYYYYQFEHQGRKSLIGRTKTAPSGDNSHVRFAVVSCSNFENGYFNAYEHITYRNDIDAVLHLGDYIYEYAIGGLPGSMAGRPSEPPHEIITLEDYRVRYSHYRLDHQFRGVHQQYPFITTWDDHETANNSWYGGAENHTPGTEGDWFVRKSNGKQAYFEWLPVRESTVDSSRVYRKLSYGNLADLIVLDTRIEGRDKQGGINNQDTNRTMLGHVQYNWLISNLNDTSSQWKIIAQQVMMAPLVLGTIGLNDDQWDGYPQERLKLFSHILNNNIKNFVVLTGDIHTSWANELKIPGLNSVGVEFVTTSVTTANAEIVGIPLNPAIFFPHVKWADIIKHGYTVVDITKDRTQSDWYFVNTINEIDTSTSLAASWFVNNGERTLNQAQNSAPGLSNQAPLAPFTVDNSSVGIARENQILVIGTYPNPFTDKLLIQYYSKESAAIRLQVVAMNGEVVMNKIMNGKQPGVNYLEVSLPGLTAGSYLLVMGDEVSAFSRLIFKAD